MDLEPMLSSALKRIIPCLDITEGRVVKGVNFVGLKDAGDPIEIAQRYNDQGADEITLLDITATSHNKHVILPILEQIAKKITIPITVGGGIKELADIQRLLDAGADKISINSAAIKNPDLVKEASNHYGSETLIVAIDAKLESQTSSHKQWGIYTHGGKQATGLDAIEWAKKMFALGAGELLVTSMDKDGTRSGFDLHLTRAISDAVPLPVIASGGVGSLQDLADGIIYGGASAVLAASIFHYGQYTIEECKEFMAQQGIAVIR